MIFNLFSVVYSSKILALVQSRVAFSCIPLWLTCARTCEPRHDKTNKMTVRPAKTQISLGIHPVWSEFSLSTCLATSATHWEHMPSLIWVFAGRTAILLVLSCRGSCRLTQEDLRYLVCMTSVHVVSFWRHFPPNVKLLKEHIFKLEPNVQGRVCKTSLTHISLASHLWDIGKQCRPRSDATERGVWSGSTLFAHKNFYQKYDKNEKSTPDTP